MSYLVQHIRLSSVQLAGTSGVVAVHEEGISSEIDVGMEVAYWYCNASIHQVRPNPCRLIVWNCPSMNG